MGEDGININVFFFGSPGDGFAAFPADYTRLVSGYDRAERDYKLECMYEITPANSVIRYVEYGLTGEGQHGTSRGGRNFGIWVELEGLMVNSNGQKKILDFLKEFVQMGIINKAHVLKASGSSKHYTIFSFNEVSEKLVQLQKVFAANFVNDFHTYFEPVNEDSIRKIDLNPAPKKERKSNQAYSSKDLYNPQTKTYQKIAIKEKERAAAPRKEYHKINAFVLLVLLSLIVWQSVQTCSSIRFKDQVNDRLKKLERIGDSPSEFMEKQEGEVTMSTIEMDDEPKDSITPVPNHPGVYEVKSGENLKQIVIDYNNNYGTDFNTDQIRVLNGINKNHDINAGQEIKFPKENEEQ